MLADGRTCQLQFWWRHKHEIQAGQNACRPHDSHGGCRPRAMQSQGCSGEPVGQERSRRPPMGLQEAERPVTCEKCSPERRLEWFEGSPLGRQGALSVSGKVPWADLSPWGEHGATRGTRFPPGPDAESTSSARPVASLS